MWESIVNAISSLFSSGGAEASTDVSGYGDVGYTAGDAASTGTSLAEAGGMAAGLNQYLTPEQDLLDEYGRAALSPTGNVDYSGLASTESGQGAATATPSLMGGLGESVAEGAKTVGRTLAQPEWQKLLMMSMLAGAGPIAGAIRGNPSEPKMPAPSRMGAMPTMPEYTPPPGSKASPIAMQGGGINPAAVKVSQGLSRRRQGGFAV